MGNTNQVGALQNEYLQRRLNDCTSEVTVAHVCYSAWLQQAQHGVACVHAGVQANLQESCDSMMLLGRDDDGQRAAWSGQTARMRTQVSEREG
jgi:hypothetical protein